MAETILSLTEVHTHIGQHHILQGVTLDITAGRPTILLGRNGAGKSTTLRTVMALNPATSGDIAFAGTPIAGRKPYEIARLGVGFVPEEKAVLYNLTVEENFRLSMLEESEKTWERADYIFELFPALKQFWRRRAGLLSGGQKQMLAIARVFVSDHRLLLIDEPSKGLAPIVVDQLGEALNAIKDKTTIILVEQNLKLAMQVGTDYFILDDGRVVLKGQMQALADDHETKKKYLGIG
jgi:branched-chain amino acid transport system ATP-binding protein